LVWFGERNKISQIINDYLYLPFFLLIILWYGVKGRKKASDDLSLDEPRRKRFWRTLILRGNCSNSNISAISNDFQNLVLQAMETNKVDFYKNDLMLVLAHTLQRHSCAMDSVADPGCLSRIPIFTHPGSLISDPETATKERRKKISCQTFFCSHKFHKIKKLFYF
jgi:hypothetical protein